MAEPTTFSCAYCDRVFPTPLGVELHGVRVHHRREVPWNPKGGEPQDGGTDDTSSVGESAASEAQIEEPEEVDLDSRPPSEDESIVAVAHGLRTWDHIRLGSGRSREAIVRNTLESARRKAAHDPSASDEQITGQFLMGAHRRLLTALRACGVGFRPTPSSSDDPPVEDLGSGG